MRWLDRQEIPTIVLKHVYDTPETEPTSGPLSTNQLSHMDNIRSPEGDPFAAAHPRIAQSITEAHERARAFASLRKPCTCSLSASGRCPPSHAWAPPPDIPVVDPVLPPNAPPFAAHSIGSVRTDRRTFNSKAPKDGQGASGGSPSVPQWASFTGSTLEGEGQLLSAHPSISASLPFGSKMAILDTLNFDLGAINSNTEHGWMAFF